MQELQYIHDETGKETAVIVPIELWKEISSEKETAYLLKSKKMKKRIYHSRNRDSGLTLQEAHEKFGI